MTHDYDCNFLNMLALQLKANKWHNYYSSSTKYVNKTLSVRQRNDPLAPDYVTFFTETISKYSYFNVNICIWRDKHIEVCNRIHTQLSHNA